ncbi:hypothetical protein [Leptospira sp. 'Mane']|uniref:hypothetical protein n=1 Tax=Leptospira sp. 'Mane' TaxID=3387407 RepID=UPI00398B6785
MQFEELTDTIKGKLYERIGNSFLFSYTLFFLTINWKFFYLVVLKKELKNIEDFLQDQSLEIYKPICYSLLYTIFMPIIVLISETYSEFIKTGTLFLRNFMRKNWQEHELSTIKEIENKYISKIQELESMLNLHTRDYQDLSDNILQWYRIDRNIPETTVVEFWSCNDNIIPGDVAINNNGVITRQISNKNQILGIIVYKPSSYSALIVKNGFITTDIINLAEKQNINKPGKYFLSTKSPSRLEYLAPELKGVFQIVGESFTDGSFKIEISSESR